MEGTALKAPASEPAAPAETTPTGDEMMAGEEGEVNPGGVEGEESEDEGDDHDPEVVP